MATAKKTVTLSAQVSTKDITVTDIVDAQKFVGAPDSARVSVTNVGPGYMQPIQPGQVTDGSTEAPAEVLPYSVTFSWTEDK